MSIDPPRRGRCGDCRRFASSTSTGTAQTAPRFAIDATWPKELPEGWITGQLGGVCRSAQDHVYVVNRRNITDEEKETSISAPSIIKFDVGRQRRRLLGRPDHGAGLDPRLRGRPRRQRLGRRQRRRHHPEIRAGRKAADADRHPRQVRLGRRHPPRRWPRTRPATSSTCRPASRSIPATATSTWPTATATGASSCSTRTASSCGSGAARPRRRRSRGGAAACSRRSCTASP